jgi:hypothetical protein
MTTIEKIEHNVKRLNPEELAAFRRWFAEFDADQWDRQIEEDVNSGKLDKLAQQAIEAHKAGRTKPL